ncbi:MAG: amidohydrolase family protein [Opitutales bacterium]
MNFIDTNVWCGSWPFTPISRNGTADIDRRLRRFGISEALVSPFETVFQDDPMPGNRALLKALEKRKGLRPLPVLNPGTAAWEDHLEELSKCLDVVGVRILPAYHGYRLNAVAVRRLAERLESKKIRLVITARLVDERHEHRALTIKPASVAQLAGFVGRNPKVNPLIQGLGTHELKEMAKADGRFLTDTSFAEWEDTLRVLKGFMPISRVLFGSLSPLQVTRAQVDKVRLSSLSGRQRESVARGNAGRYFGI